jgi:16S rRNA (cytosine1402-N4)-methyltransferase
LHYVCIFIVDTFIHVPVMVKEIIENLNVKNKGIYADMTVGMGGHALAILSKMPTSKVIAIDRDEEALIHAKERLKGYKVYFVHERFSQIKSIINHLGIDEVDGIVLDPGLSAIHLHSPERGFSFLKDEPLDMRMNKRQALTAQQVVNYYSQEQLRRILRDYGEERFSQKIARAVVTARRKKHVTTCCELSEIIIKAVPRRGKIHPATRTFQALRIEVNKELDELSNAITQGVGILKKGGIICALSYHSLEDRIVKQTFKQFSQEKILRIKTKKPLIPSQEERSINPSSRSAKLRIGEKVL